MGLLDRIFGTKKATKSHGERYAEIGAEHGSDLNARLQAMREAERDFSTQFSYSVNYTGQPHQFSEHLKESIFNVREKHLGQGSCAFDVGENSLWFNFFCVCLDNDEVEKIESEIEELLRIASCEFSKLAPERCSGCNAVVRRWEVIEVQDEAGTQQVLGCSACNTPRP